MSDPSQGNRSSILWRRLDAPGHDAARLELRSPSWRLHGTALFGHEGRACRLDYSVVCDSSWQTVSAHVSGWIDEEIVDVALTADAARRWWRNGVECPDVLGCVDVDLCFTPATNLLPIRRLGLTIGQTAPVRAAWLGFPGLALEPLDQTYRRTGLSTYRYESGGGTFVADLDVDATGFVIRYPGLWEAEA